jgi:hypothetical protein
VMRALGELRGRKKATARCWKWRTLHLGGLSVRCSVRIGKVSRPALDCGFAKRALAFHVTGDFFTAVYSETQGPSRKILNTDIVSFPAAPAARISLTVQAKQATPTIHHVASAERHHHLATVLRRPLVAKEKPEVGGTTMNPANWIIALCATGAHNYTAIVACILVSSALAPSLATARERRSGGDESPVAVEQQGVTVATWYGPGYEGRRTTSGELFDSSKLTAASLVFPLGSHVTVTSLKSGRSVTVRINDCGSHLRRKIDLSRAAAQPISSIKDGVVPVRIRIVAAPKHASLCTSRHVELSAAPSAFLP